MTGLLVLVFLAIGFGVVTHFNRELTAIEVAEVYGDQTLTLTMDSAAEQLDAAKKSNAQSRSGCYVSKHSGKGLWIHRF